MFINLLFLSTLISISSNSWMGMWFGLEINLLSIIPLMNNIKNSYSSESSIKYFIIQALASSIILMSLIFFIKYNNSYFFNYNNLIIMIFNSSLMMKMGSAPFHFWMPEIMEGLNWILCFIMFTWQKIIPIIMLNYFFMSYNFIIIIIIFNLLISGIMGINQISLRKILTYSSINNISWMLSSIMFFQTIWIYYLLIYSMILMNLIYFFNKFKIFYLKQLYNFMSKSININFFILMNFFSLSGIPPFIGFFPKWLVIQVLIFNKMIFLSMFLILMTLITMYFYTQLMMSTLNFNIYELNFIKYKLNMNSIFYLNFINLMSLIFCTMIINMN
uniref:NADH-ubiquinone oxidoreductase chain 2 n=1 Tax=Pselaphinae sp. 1 EF-2015 TaxID=1756853 RepID=A0A0S2M8H9_9COLE|nr:NADH deshydrogenase subunit 2 [Pselaphinae sp. 1 EF-2015]